MSGLGLRPEGEMNWPTSRCALDVFMADRTGRWSWTCYVHKEDGASFTSLAAAEKAADGHERNANHYIHGAEQ